MENLMAQLDEAKALLVAALPIVEEEAENLDGHLDTWGQRSAENLAKRIREMVEA